MVDKKNKQGFDTRAIHAGQEPDPTTGAIMTPIYTSSTYVQESPGVHKGYDYSRSINPTRKALEACIADLEGSSFGYAFSSGMAACSTVLEVLNSGDHVLAMDDLYGGTYRLFEDVRKRLILKSFKKIIFPAEAKDSFLIKEGIILLKGLRENNSIKIFLIIIKQPFNFY